MSTQPLVEPTPLGRPASLAATASGSVNYTGPTAATASAGTNGAAPTQVAGYLLWQVNGQTVKIPYYSA